MALSEQISSNTPLEELHRIFALQQKNRQKVKNSSIKQRIKKINHLKQTILKYRKRIQTALHQDFKKHPTEVDLTEIYPVISEAKHIIAHLAEWIGPKQVETPMAHLGSIAEIRYEPKGCCLIISPWNYPFYLSMMPVMSAIAAGNVLMLKPSEFTPHVNQVMQNILTEVFEPEEAIIVEGDHTIASALLKLKFEHIHFTGSPQVGKIVMRASSAHLSSATLELGGKSPVIVDETAHIKEAAKKITWGKLINKGQTCIAPDYMLVHELVMDELIEAIKKQIRLFYGKDIKQSPDLCRIINKRHFERIKKLIVQAIKDGATVEMGGNFDATENYIEPTLLSDVSLDTPIMQEEIFGPVLPIIPYSNIEEALEIINHKEKPLALYIFSKSTEQVNHVLQHTSAGGTCVNDTLLHIAQPYLPFGGVNNSGIGKSHGWYGFLDFSNQRSILKQLTPWAANQSMYPPYNTLAKQMVNVSMKFF